MIIYFIIQIQSPKASLCVLTICAIVWVLLFAVIAALGLPCGAVILDGMQNYVALEVER